MSEICQLDGLIDEMLIYADLERPEPRRQLANEVIPWLEQRRQEGNPWPGSPD